MVVRVPASVRALVILAVAVSTGCDSGAGTEGKAPKVLEAGAADPTLPPTPPAMRAVANVRQTMDWILDPAADVIWGSAGTIITAEGQQELTPTTDAGWAQVRNSAAVVAEAGNLLMVAGRSAGPEWDAHSERLIAAGELAIAAAQAQDADALFDAGGELYQACLACHSQFMPDARVDLP